MRCVAARAGDGGGGLRTAGGRPEPGPGPRWWPRPRPAPPCWSELGLAGRHVGVLLDNVPEFVFLLGGAALSGAVVVGVNPTRRGEELARDVRHTDCAVVLTDAAHAPLLAGLDLGAPVRLVDEPAWARTVERHRGRRVPGEPARAGRAVGAAVHLGLDRGAQGGADEPGAGGPHRARPRRPPSGRPTSSTAPCRCSTATPCWPACCRAWPRGRPWCSGAASRRRSSWPTCAATAAPTSTTSGGRWPTCWPGPRRRPTPTTRWCGASGSEASPRDRAEFRRRFGCYVTEGYSSSEGGVVIQPFRGMPPEALGRPAEGVDVAVLDPETGDERPRARFGPGARAAQRRRRRGRDRRPGRPGRLRGLLRQPRGRRPSGPGAAGTGPATSATGTRTAPSTSRAAPPTGCGSTARTSRRGRWRPSSAGSRAWPRWWSTACPIPAPATRSWRRSSSAAGAAFDPDAFAAFLAAQPDLGTKWAPRFVRVVGVPAHHRHRQGRPRAAAGRALGDRRPGVVAAGPRRRLPAAHGRPTRPASAGPSPRRDGRGCWHEVRRHPPADHPPVPPRPGHRGRRGRAGPGGRGAGFSGFGFTDHPAPSQRWLEAGGHDALDPFVALGYAAAHTTTLRLVPNIVVLPYRNPFVVAKAACHPGRAVGRALHAGRGVRLPEGRVRGRWGWTTTSATTCSTRRSTPWSRSGPATT